MIRKLFNVIVELKLLGIQGSIYRIYYELKSRVNPGKNIKLFNISEINLNIEYWRKKKIKCFFPSIPVAKTVLETILTEKDKQKIIKIADQAIEGEIICFSKWTGDYGNPINWHYNPHKKVTWPNNVPSSIIMRHEEECGDIKLPWELNRFPHIYYLVRAYVLTGDSKYVISFTNQLKLWEESNPYPYGVNWFNGQELAIRLYAWIFALYMMGDDDSFKEEDFERFVRLLYLHTKHIEKHINYAYYAVHNNHLIGEALALYTSGILFPFFQESKKWKKKGKKILEDDRCLKQFYEDGGYCQLSFNYQRLALHYYIWAIRIGELNGDNFSNNILKVIDNSFKFLYSFINSNNGQLPNWGTNDGALLNPWTSCDYSDFRPVLNTLYYSVYKKRIFESGPWDEELFWFFGKKALNSICGISENTSTRRLVTGLHVIRNNKNTFATFRCGSITDRFGQADMNHVDVWWKGINIAIDGGSYLYNDDLQYHKYFMGTKSHNTVIVDNQDQMFLHRRFKWLYWTKAKLLKTEVGYFEGEHYGYKRLKGKIIHKRSIESINENSFLINDYLHQIKKNKHAYELHWLLNDFSYRVETITQNAYVVQLNTPFGAYYMKIESDCDSILKINRSASDKKNPDGWRSLYYGKKVAALSIHLICKSTDGCKFSTFFTDHFST